MMNVRNYRLIAMKQFLLAALYSESLQHKCKFVIVDFIVLYYHHVCVFVLFSLAVDITDRDEMLKIIRSSVGTKFIRKW